MVVFNIDNLQSPLKKVYETQLKFCDSNWQATLKKHNKEISKMLEKADLFDIWSNMLSDESVAKSLIPEIFMDAFISIHFACMGVYKYANACLRSELESTLRLVYFSVHPIEFEWWCDGNEWYVGKDKDVWGEGYKYFENLSTVKEFDKKISENKRLFVKSSRIKGTYKRLSRYVHSGISTFQTSLTFSPQYRISDFKKWLYNYNEVQQCINIIIGLGFAEKFKEMKEVDQRKILKIGLYDNDYRKRLKDIFGLKIRGRI